MSAEDIARITVAADFGPLVELLFSATARQGPRGDLLFGPWWCQLAAEARRPGRTVAMFGGITPPIDLISVIGRSCSIEHALEELLRARPEILQAELDDSAARPGASPAWVHELPRSMGARRRLETDLRDFYTAAVAPHWARIQSLVDNEAARYARLLATRGLQYFLNVLHPDLSWSSPVLVMRRRWKVVTDLDPQGRGVVIVPSVFSRQVRVYAPIDPCEGPITIVVPAMHSIAVAQHLWQPDHRTGSKSLAALLGETRAAVLEAASSGCTTTELARHVRISLATASYHAAVLRDADLIQSERLGSAVLHTVTGLGASLLNGSPSPLADDGERVIVR